MKKALFLKTLALIVGLMFQATISWGQLLAEDFDYPIGSLLTANGWTAHSGAGTQPIDVTTGLNFAGYIGSGIGGAALLDNTGEDDNRTFAAQTAGSVYMAFMVKVQTTAAGYFMHFGTNGWSTTFRGKLFLDATNHFGVSVGSNTPTVATNTYTVGNTYFLVLKYEIVDGTNNDIVSLYVFDGAFPTSEPVAPTIGPLTDASQTDINPGGVGLRQFSATQNIIVDGIRIATNWGDAATAASSNSVATPTFSPTPGVTENPVDVTISCSTPNSSIYYTLDGSDPDENSTPFTIPFNVSQTTTIKARAYAEGFDPSYIATAIYTFRTQVSTIAELRAGTTGVPYLLTGEVFVTYFQAWRNQIFVQDYTGAILIDDASNTIVTEYEIGDGFAGLKGSLTIYQGMLQFVPVADPGDPSGFHVFTPEVITVAQLTSNFENYEAELVKIENVTFANGGGTFVYNTVYPISDVSDATGNFKTSFLDVDYLATSTTIPIGPSTIIGICNSNGSPTFDGYITSRSAAEIIPNVATPTIIVTSPDGGEFWQQGTTETIKWGNLNFTGNVTIQLLKPPFSVTDLAVNIANNGTWVWAIPADLALGSTYKIRVKGVNNGDPSDDSDATFSIVEYVGLPRIVINEIMYNSIEAGDNEWIELYNMEAIGIDLEGFVIKDNLNTHAITIPAGYSILPNGYFTVAVSTGTPPLFFTPDYNGAASWGLNNDADQVRLYAPDGIVIDSVQYSDSSPWPTGADGTGPSLELIDPSLDNTMGQNWLASAATNGTPGAQNSMFGFQGLTVSSPNGGEQWLQGSTQAITWTSTNFTGTIKIELETIAEGLVTLAENIPAADLTWSWAIPADQALGSNYKIKISDQADGNPMDESDATFSITSATIETLELTSPNGGEQWMQGSTYPINWISTNFSGTIKIELETIAKSFVTLAENIPAADLTWSWVIPADQAVGSNYKIKISDQADGDPTDASDATFSVIVPPSLPKIVITEIMYNSPESGTDSLEFIELFNNDVLSVELAGWSFTQGVDYVFPAYTMLPGEYLVVAYKSSAILNTFGIVSLQWTSGALGNGGEALELKNASAEVIDYVLFDDVAPWPLASDDYGPSLMLCDPSSDNALAKNWSPAIEFVTFNAAGAAIYATPGAGCSGELAQTMIIPTGWAGVSSYMIPTNPATNAMFAPIVNAVVVVQDFSKLYLPAQGINTIGNWDVETGYQTKLTANKYFVVKGAYETNKTISLTAGWNGIPVISTCPVDAVTLFASVPEIIFAKEMGSNLVYWPDGGLATLTTLVPGRAYFVKTTAAVNLTFPECAGKGDLVIDEPVNKISSIWNEVTPTGASHAIGFGASALANLQVGDVIGAFSSNGVCSGITAVGEGNALIMAWADDVYTLEVDGFIAEEQLSYKVYRPSTGEVFEVSAVYGSNSPDAGNFVTHGISFVTELKMGATGINTLTTGNVRIYPNPATSAVNIEMEQQFTGVEVYSMVGSLLYAGNVSGNMLKLDVSNFERGVYFLKLINQNSGDQLTTRFIKE